MPKNTNDFNLSLQQMMENIRKMVEDSRKRSSRFKKIEPVAEISKLEDLPIQNDTTLVDNRVSWLNQSRKRTHGGFVTSTEGTKIWNDGGQLD